MTGRTQASVLSVCGQEQKGCTTEILDTKNLQIRYCLDTGAQEESWDNPGFQGTTGRTELAPVTEGTQDGGH